MPWQNPLSRKDMKRRAFNKSIVGLALGLLGVPFTKRESFIVTDGVLASEKFYYIGPWTVSNKAWSIVSNTDWVDLLYAELSED